MFVWVCHRITGVLLIVLLGLKLVTSFFLMKGAGRPDWALVLHTNALSDVLLILCIVFHSVYGLRTIVYELGYHREKLLFWGSTLLGIAAMAALLTIYFQPELLNGS